VDEKGNLMWMHEVIVLEQTDLRPTPTLWDPIAVLGDGA